MRKYFQMITTGLFFGVILFIFLPSTVTADNSEEIRRLIDKFSKAVTKVDVVIAAERVSTFGPEATPHLIKALSSRSKYGAIQALGLIKDERVIDALGEMLAQMPEQYQSGYGYVSEDMAVKILEQRGSDGVRGLVRALQTHDNNVKRKVAEALGRSGDRNAVPGLVLALPFPYAAVALGELKDPLAVEGLVSALPMDKAMVALGKIGDTRAVVPLLRIMCKERNYSAEDAMTVLNFPLITGLYVVASGIPEGINLVEQQTIFTDRIVQLLVSRKLNERILAETAIARIGRMMVPSLVKALGSSDDVHLRRATAEQLGKMQGQNIENALVKALQDRDPLVVAYAARSLGEVGSLQAFEFLANVAKKGSVFERRGAVWAMARTENSERDAVLKEFCNDKDEYVRRIAINGLSCR